MTQSERAQGGRAWARADEQFHKLLLELAGNSRLAAISVNFWDQTHRVRMITRRLRPKPVSSTKDHWVLIRAIQRGDAETARKVHRAHREAGGAMLVDSLERLNLRRL